MKKRKTIVSLLAMAAAVMLVFQSSIVASAANNTYILRYDGKDWNYKEGASWNDNSDDAKNLYYLEQIIKDGDLVVVEGPGTALSLNVHLSNLTFINGAQAIVTANGIDNVYILAGCSGAVNGDITNAYVYGDGAVTFNNNISNLEIIGETVLNADVNVDGGTVGHLVGRDNDGVYYDYYAFAKGKLLIEDGNVKTDEEFYSKTPVAVQSAPQSAQSTAGQTNSSEYDDVPKTGDSMACWWLLGTAAVCLVGKYALKRL